jgi:hypothetical protein
MLFGHNSNVKVGEVTFHVQTEDRGVPTALIDTTIFYQGRVMHRRTNNYHDLVPLNPDREEALRLRLDEQHRATIEDIRSGALHLAAPAATASVTIAPNSGNPVSSANATAAAHESTLKLELRNASSWVSGKQARLEIRVSTPTGEPSTGAKVVAYIEGAETHEKFSGETDPAGATQISFTMPRLSGSPSALVIEAERNPVESTSRGKAHGKLRFALRTKPRPAQ